VIGSTANGAQEPERVRTDLNRTLNRAVLVDTRQELAEVVKLLFASSISFAVIHGDNGQEYVRTTEVGEVVVTSHFAR
jgi:hypothetical protein